jgi:uncharacterized protein YcbX
MHRNLLVTHLFVYPVKGLSGVAIHTSFVTIRGLKYDRRWMLIDEHHQFISQRSFPNLCLFKVGMGNEGFRVTYNSKSITIPPEIGHGDLLTVKVWGDEVRALKASDEVNDFFSQQLNFKCSLVYMPDNSNRWVDKNFVLNDTPVSFADGYPILMIGAESLNLLNSKLIEHIEIDRFRPNIVFEGGDAHMEDTLKKFTIADVDFKGIKPCARCQVPGINQQTGIVSKEPTRTLASYRNFDHKINFGQNIIVMNEGEIRVGDKIILDN